MTYSELVDEVMLMVQDDSKYDAILGYVNMALVEATSKVMMPEYKRASSFETLVDSPYVALQVQPDTFVGGVVKVFGDSVKNAAVYKSLDDMIDGEEITDVMATGAEIKALAVEGSNIWYHPLPEEPVTILVLYYTTHAKLCSPDDAVTIFPDHIQRKAICARAAELCFEKIEDGIDGAKVNTAAYANTAAVGIQELHEFVGRNRRHFVSSVWGV